MTDVDSALTRDEEEDSETRVSAGAADTEISDPFTAPPEIQKSITFVAEQRHSRCYTPDTTLQSVLFRLRARNIDASVGPPARYVLNLALVVDRSGSMEGRALELVKRACGSLVDLLDPADYLTVISFAETADLVLLPRHGGNKAAAKDAINKIAAGNTTNMHQGLMLAYQQIAAVKDSSTLNRVILITDGEPTAGTKDYASILGTVADQKARGISVTTVGLGHDYAEDLLDGIAHRSGGNYYHLAAADGLVDVMKAEHDSLNQTIAKNVRMRVKLASGVGVRQIYGHQPNYGNRVVDLTLADVEASKGLESLWDFEISTRPAGSYRIAEADLRYDDLNTGRPEQLAAALIYTFVSGEDQVDAPNADFEQYVEVAEAIRNIDKTLLAVRRQNLDKESVLNELDRAANVFNKYGRQRQLGAIKAAAEEIQAGGSVVKILLSTIYNLDQGKTH